MSNHLLDFIDQGIFVLLHVRLASVHITEEMVDLLEISLVNLNVEN